MRNSQWLASEDIDGLGDVKVAIEAVYVHRDVAFDDGRKKPVVYAIAFKGKDRQLILCAENRRHLQDRFGANVKDWAGKEISLYVKDGVRSPKGGTTKGIRIR